jgi:hypothetical protein
MDSGVHSTCFDGKAVTLKYQKASADATPDVAAKPTFLPIKNNDDYALRQLALIFFIYEISYIFRRGSDGCFCSAKCIKARCT